MKTGEMYEVTLSNKKGLMKTDEKNHPVIITSNDPIPTGGCISISKSMEVAKSKVKDITINS